MTLDEIRRLAAEERAVAEKATPGPWEFDPVLDGCIDGPAGGAVAHVAHHTSMRTVARTGEAYSFADAEHIARSRTAVPALCDAVDALLAVVDALPKCMECLAPATKRSDQRAQVYCDAHAPPQYEASGGQMVSWHDNVYAVALRGVLGGCIDGCGASRSEHCWNASDWEKP